MSLGCSSVVLSCTGWSERGVDFPAGVAANLVALAYLATEQGRHDDVGRLLDEADRLATTVQANAVSAWITEARANISLRRGCDRRDVFRGEP